MKSLLALMGILLLGTTLVAESHAQSRRDDILRRRDGSGASRDRNRDGNRGGRVDRGRGNGRVVRDRDNGRRNPDVGRRRDDGRRNPDVGRDTRRDNRRDDRWDNRRPDDRRRPDVGRDSRRPNRNHRPGWNNPGRRYTRYNHNPRRDRIRHQRRYQRRYDYHRTIPYRHVYNNRWIRFRVSYGNGYTTINGYPYFVYNGYRHRYSHYDTCDYELVDGYDNRVERTFFGYTCAQAYDYCAEVRDDLNYRRSGYRYFCSERIEFVGGYDYYDHWDYEDDFYYDVY